MHEERATGTAAATSHAAAATAAPLAPIAASAAITIDAPIHDNRLGEKGNDPTAIAAAAWMPTIFIGTTLTTGTA